tara:strand:- start:1947 stop:2351 length:405 start_codon:yes stop_codon:yes gene_type:complete
MKVKEFYYPEDYEPLLNRSRVVPICSQCKERKSDKQFCKSEKTCWECLESDRYVMEVEFKHPELDYGVISDTDLKSLVKRFRKAQKTGFDTSTGSCPSIKILSVSDVYLGILVEPGLISKIFDEIDIDIIRKVL